MRPGDAKYYKTMIADKLSQRGLLKAGSRMMPEKRCLRINRSSAACSGIQRTQKNYLRIHDHERPVQSRRYRVPEERHILLSSIQFVEGPDDTRMTEKTS